MPYTEATLRENMRLETGVPSGVPHAALRDTKLAGYDVPKVVVYIVMTFLEIELINFWQGAFIVTGLQSAHLDATKFDNPLQFRPERFLDESSGQLCLSKDVSMPFGSGKRLCAGETFSRNIIFLISTMLAQNFNIHELAGEPIPRLDERITGVISLTPHFWAGLKIR